ncbi:MAG: hypothetical protein ACTS73_08725 [Arsenophonus sp. NEOnobi-MAG3]
MAKVHHKNKWFSYLRYMLNSLTLLESEKIGINLKTAFRWMAWRHCFFSSSVIAT